MPGRTRSASRNKCKSGDSRTQGFKLLFRLLQALRPREVAHFLDEYLWRLIEPVPRPAGFSYSASGSTVMRGRWCKYGGIRNLGCICYMISMLQQLFMVPQFRYRLMRAVDQEKEDIKTYKDRQVDDRFLTQLQKLFGYLELSDRSFAEPFELCFAFKDWDGEPTQVSVQKDAQEFVLAFFGKLEDLLSKTSQKYLLQDTFELKQVEEKICQSCGKTRHRLRADYMLKVQVKDMEDIYKALQSEVQGQTIEGFQCDGCNEKVSLKKRNLLGAMPNVLIVQEQRIEFTDAGEQRKVNSRFEFPEILDLSPYSFKAQSAQGTATAENEEEKAELEALLEQVADDDYLYRLVGVNIHRGQVNAGHYWSYINSNRGEDEPDGAESGDSQWQDSVNSNWLKFDDGHVSQATKAELRRDGLGGGSQSSSDPYSYGGDADYGMSAYMLVYERKSKNEIREVTNPESDRAQEDEEEKVERVNFRQVDTSVPDWIRRIVEQDNLEFCFNRQIYDKQFFYLVRILLEHTKSTLSISQHEYPLEYSPNFSRMHQAAVRVGHKVAFDFLPAYGESSAASGITDALSSSFCFSETYVSYTPDEQRPLLVCDWLEGQLLANQGADFFELMLKCGSASARSHCANLVSGVVERAFANLARCEEKPEMMDSTKVERLRSILRRLLEQVTDVIFTKDCQRQWARLEQFYGMVADIATSGPL